MHSPPCPPAYRCLRKSPRFIRSGLNLDHPPECVSRIAAFLPALKRCRIRCSAVILTSCAKDKSRARSFRAAGPGNKSGQVFALRISKVNHLLSAGIYAVDLAARPEKLSLPCSRASPEVVGASPKRKWGGVDSVLQKSVVVELPHPIYCRPTYRGCRRAGRQAASYRQSQNGVMFFHV